jgi:hypothetical protein
MAAARERMEQAAKNLDEVREDLERSERSLAAARNRARAAAQVESEQAAAGGKELDDLAQRLEAVEPQAGPEMLDRTRALLEELAKLQAAVQAEQLDAAGQSAKQAQMSLDQLLESLKRRAADASDKPPEAPTQAKLDELAAQQAELQRQAAELMRRLSELPDQGFQEPAGRAQQAMQGAQGALSRGDPQEGATREKEAAEELDKAAQQLSGEQNRYERLRQDEVLFRLNEDLTALLKRQQELSGQTRDLQEARGEEDRPLAQPAPRGGAHGRAGARPVGAVRGHPRRAGAGRGAGLRARADADARRPLVHRREAGRRADGLDCADAAGRRGAADLGSAGRARRRAPAPPRGAREARGHPQGQQPPGGQQGPEPLVPTVAELLLIQRLEQAALARLDAFSRTAAADKDGLDEGARDLLQRWASEHEKVTELFRQKFQGPAGSPRHRRRPRPRRARDDAARRAAGRRRRRAPAGAQAHHLPEPQGGDAAAKLVQRIQQDLAEVDKQLEQAAGEDQLGDEIKSAREAHVRAIAGLEDLIKQIKYRRSQNPSQSDGGGGGARARRSRARGRPQPGRVRAGAAAQGAGRQGVQARAEAGRQQAAGRPAQRDPGRSATASSRRRLRPPRTSCAATPTRAGACSRPSCRSAS